MNSVPAVSRLRLTMRLLALVLLLFLLGSEQVFDLTDETISLLLETALPGESVTRARGRGRGG